MTVIRYFAPGGVERHDMNALPQLLGRDAGFVWVDLSQADGTARDVLEHAFDFHPLAVRDCFEATPVPKIHAYADHLFLVLHAPLRGPRRARGHAPAGPVHRSPLPRHRARGAPRRSARW